MAVAAAERPHLYTVDTADIRPETQQDETIFLGDLKTHEILSAEGSIAIQRGTLTSVESLPEGLDLTFIDESGVIFKGRLSGNNESVDALQKAQGGDVIASRPTFGNEIVAFSVNPPKKENIIPYAAD